MTDILYPRLPYLKHKMPNEKETEDIIIKKGEMLYEELGELGRRVSSVKGDTIRIIRIRIHETDSQFIQKTLFILTFTIKKWVQRLDNLQNNFNLVMKDSMVVL